MLKKIISIITLFFITVSFVNAQKEQYNWLFGFNAGLMFGISIPYTATGVYGTANATLTLPYMRTGAMQTYEGCFSTSDARGNLLFYSDGITIWNKNNQEMVTGLSGDPSSAQSGIILPYPNTPNKYIAVTLGKDNSNNLSYTVVDMSLNGGLGGTVPATTNIQLTGQTGALGESVFAVRHTNKEDFWIVAPGRTTTTSYLNVWKVTSAGVQASRHSVATAAIGFTALGANGYLKFTTDGLHYVWADFLTAKLVYGDFNPTTGTITSVKIRNAYAPFNNHLYGVEFSPSGRYLYLTQAPGSLNSMQQTGLLVYDFNALLATNTPNSINPVKTLLNSSALSDGVADHFGGIQLGPDGNMYITRFASNGMFVITNPESPTAMNIYKLLNFLPGNGYWGLPNFAAPWFRLEITPPDDGEVCATASNNYKVDVIAGMGLSNVTKLVIDYGDGSTPTTYTRSFTSSYVYSLFHTYDNPGVYTTTATVYNASGGVELTTSSQVTVRMCQLKVNPQIRVRATN